MSEIRLQCCYVLLKRVIQSLIVDFQKEFFQKVCLPLIFLDCLDEVRICPLNARMTTYTYHPNGNKISETDENGISTYYKYTSNVSTALAVQVTMLKCRSVVTGQLGITNKITITQEFQKKSGFTWSSINGRGTTKFTFTQFLNNLIPI